MKRQLFIVDGEFKSYADQPGCLSIPMLTRCVSESEQAAYEFGRQEKAEEILEALAREFFGEKKP